MDLDALLDRRPQLALVDELAHTNVPGSRNRKRWQDVEELLDAGIDVISTVNIQHLESLNDVVEQITGVVQRETIPDEVVRRADQLQLVDLAVETIRARLASGDIYPAERVDAAWATTSARAIWPRCASSPCSGSPTGSRRAWQSTARATGSPTPGRLASAFWSPSPDRPDGDRLVRRAARMAQRLNADLIAVHVRPQTGLATPSAGLLEQQGRLVERLGGSYREVAGADVGEALVETARALNATQVVLGAKERSGWSEFVYGSVVSTVIRLSGVGLDVHVIGREAGGETDAAREPKLHRPRALPRRRVALGFALGAVAAPLLAGVLTQARNQVPPSSALLLFLLLVVCVSAVGGLWPALSVAVGGFLLVNWYLTPPLHTLVHRRPREPACPPRLSRRRRDDEYLRRARRHDEPPKLLAREPRRRH